MFIELGANEHIVAVAKEPHSREYGYVALDRRKMFLFVGTNLKNLSEGIDAYANEEMGRSSMYDSASCASRRGYIGSFRFERCPRTELPSLVHMHRGRHRHTIICATQKAAWTIGAKEQPILQEGDVLVIESNSLDSG